MKAGPSSHDKSWIGNLLFAGYTVEQISSFTAVKPEHVTNIIRQIRDGTINLRGDKMSYGRGDSEKPGVGNALLEVENQDLKDKLDGLQDQVDRILSSNKKSVEAVNLPKKSVGRPKKVAE